MHHLALLAVVFAFQDKPITVDEAREIGERIEKAMGAGDSTVLRDLMSTEPLAARMSKGLALDDEGIDMVRTTCRGLADGLSKRILEESSTSVKYRFLRVRAGAEGPRPMFRLVGNSGVNYHELVLVRTAAGIRAADCYVHASAEMLTETMRRSLLPALVAHVTKDQDKMTEVLGDLKAMSRLVELTREGRFEEALKVYDAHEARLSKDKSVHLIRIRAAGQVDEGVYLKALEDVEKRWPGEAFTDLLRIDAHLLRKEYDKSLAGVDRLDKLIGGDPYLHVLRGGILAASGKLEKAREWSARAVKEEPAHDVAWWAHVEVCLGLKDHKEVARGLSHLERELKAEIAEDLSEVELFAEFAASDEGKAWQAARRKP